MTPAIDITTAQRKTLLTLLRQFIPGVLVWAYGSRVKWTARPNSDLDLVVFTTPAQSSQVSELKDALAESNLPFPVDLHVWDEIPERFHGIIRSEYIVLQEAVEKRPHGNMVDVREEIPLSEIAEIIGGYAFKSGDFGATGFPVVKIANIEPPRVNLADGERIPAGKVVGLDRFRLSDRDIVMAMTGATIGKVGRVRSSEPSYLNQRVAKLSAKAGRKFDDFIFALVTQAGFDASVINNSNGSAQANISTDGIGRILVPDFSPEEQFQIGRVIGALDDKIELNRRMNETLEALAQSLFKSWFVDATQSALPKGWRYVTIAELCEINSWTLGKGDELDQIEYVEISEVMRGSIANIQTYERGEEPSRARRRLRHGDTVLSTVRPDRGAYFLCLNPSPNLIGSTGFAVLTPTKAPWSFIHAAMTQPDVFEYLGQQADGGAYPAVRPEIIGGLEVPWPNKPELVEKFHRTCAPLYERAELNRHESRTLAALRDALLPKLLSGELRVPAAAQLVEATP